MEQILGRFSPKLLALLLKGSMERVERKVSTPPTVENKRPGQTLTEFQRATRWKVLTFATIEDAQMFSEFWRINQQCNKLRVAMKKADHPQTEAVYNATVRIDESLGALIVEPKAGEFHSLVDLPESPERTLDHDPLADL